MEELRPKLIKIQELCGIERVKQLMCKYEADRLVDLKWKYLASVKVEADEIIEKLEKEKAAKKDKNIFKEKGVYTFVNCNEARHLIDKRVLFSNIQNAVKGNWKEGTLKSIHNYVEKCFNFRHKGMVFSHPVIKEITEEKPKIDTKRKKLITALKLSILQWSLMVECGYSKTQTYDIVKKGSEFGSCGGTCFLCDSFGTDLSFPNFHCDSCINWGEAYSCMGPTSVFRKWRKDRDEAAAKGVLDHLKSGLVRLETEEAFTKHQEFINEALGNAPLFGPSPASTYPHGAIWPHGDTE